MFRENLEARRGVILSTGFYEWSRGGEKVKYLFRLPGSRTLYLAALYDEMGRYVILTEAANASLAGVHDRMSDGSANGSNGRRLTMRLSSSSKR